MDDSDRYEDPEKYIACPFNRAHTFPKRSLLRHLKKCSVQHPNEAKKMCKCPFNTSHIVHRDKLEDHITTCSDRDHYYIWAYKTVDKQSQVVKDLYENTMIKIDIPSEEEDWYKQINESSPDNNIVKNCQQNAAERGVLQSNSNKPKAERKKLGEEQRIVAREIMNAEEKIKKMQQMSQNSLYDLESVANNRSKISGRSYYLSEAGNTAEKSLKTTSEPSSFSSSSLSNGDRDRGKNRSTKNTFKMGFGRGRR